MSYVNAGMMAVNAFSSVQAGKNARGAIESQATQMDFQAAREEAAALDTAKVIRRAGRRQVAQTGAAYAGAGVKVGEGTAQLVEDEITQDVEHDAFQALLTGDRRANALRTQADLARITGKSTEQAGNVNAANSVLRSGYQSMQTSGWRTNGPGFSGGQQGAPVETRTIKG